MPLSLINTPLITNSLILSPTPTLVVTSDGDRLYPPALAEAMARRIPGARLALIRGAGHLSNLEQPEAFDAAVLGFLLEHRARADDAHLPKQ